MAKQANRFPQNPVTIATPPRDGVSFKTDAKGENFERLDKPQTPMPRTKERLALAEAARKQRLEKASKKKASKKKASKKKASKKKVGKKTAAKPNATRSGQADNNVTPLRPDGETKE